MTTTLLRRHDGARFAVESRAELLTSDERGRKNAAVRGLFDAFNGTPSEWDLAVDEAMAQGFTVRQVEVSR